MRIHQERQDRRAHFSKYKKGDEEMGKVKAAALKAWVSVLTKGNEEAKTSWQVKVLMIMAGSLVIAGLIFSESEFSFSGMAILAISYLMDIRDKVLAIEKKVNEK